jgi:hypothetical protein
VREDAFVLAYGGLRWPYSEVMEMEVSVRRWFVERLLTQKEAEEKEMNKK